MRAKKSRKKRDAVQSCSFATIFLLLFFFAEDTELKKAENSIRCRVYIKIQSNNISATDSTWFRNETNCTLWQNKVEYKVDYVALQ